MWFLMTFPEKTEFTRDYGQLMQTATVSYEAGIIGGAERDSLIAAYRGAIAAEKIEGSFAGSIGKAVEPVIKPLGFDWRLGVAIVSGFAAKEVIVFMNIKNY